ncbi:MAG: hypothetical protein ABI333_06530 [bacterium]
MKVLKRTTAEIRQSDRVFREVLAQDPELVKAHPEAKEARRLLTHVRADLKKLVAAGFGSTWERNGGGEEWRFNLGEEWWPVDTGR